MNKIIPPFSPSSALRILDALTYEPGMTQRQVASATGLSLGMVNAILRRLSKTGLIKIKGLTGRKLSYILTPRGLSEKTRRSAEYLQHTMKTYGEIRRRLQGLLMDLHRQGHRHFTVVGDGEVAQLAEMVLREFGEDVHYVRTHGPSRVSNQSLVLDCTADGKEPSGISILSRLIGSAWHEVPAPVPSLSPESTNV